MDAAKEPVAGFGLPQVLNIIYRGRRTVLYLTLLGVIAGVAYGIITKPLFRASAQVRPGIVSYSEQGTPVREWALKDIVRWFRTGLFWDDMRVEAPYDQFQGPPIILAEFISSGPQYLRGGDVITLTNLSTDPLVAVDILKKSILSFNAQAAGDSSASTLMLTLGGAKVRMDKIRAEISKVEGERERANLGIGEQQTELAKLEAEIQRLDQAIARSSFGSQWRTAAVEKTLAEAEIARRRLADAEAMLSEVEANEAAVAGDLVASVNHLGSYIYHSTARADSLRDEVAARDLVIKDLELKKTVVIPQQMAAIRLKIDDLEIQRDVDLVGDRKALEADLQAIQVQVDMLSPLEQVGRVTVSQKPVRPRKLRALVILTFLAFMGGVFLVFLREYFLHNRKAILAAPEK